MLAIAVAALVYAVVFLGYLFDPWSSWVHIETAYSDGFLRGFTQSRTWQQIRLVIIDGHGTSPNIARIRYVNNAVELTDFFARRRLAAVFGFAPALTNLSSLVYYALSPVIAFLIARHVIGWRGWLAVPLLLSVAVFLSSVGYISPSIFVFHPAKKVVVFLALLAMLFLVRYVSRPRFADVALIGLCQIVMYWTDEMGLAAAALISSLAFVYILVLRRDRILDGAALVLCQAIGFAAFVERYRTNWDAIASQDLPGHSNSMAEMLLRLGANDFLNLTGGHLAGGFSAYYGPAVVAPLFLACAIVAFVLALWRSKAASLSPDATTLSAMTRARFLVVATGVTMILNALATVVLLQFGGGPFMSYFGFYYSSVMSVFAFVFICAAFRLAELTVQRFPRQLPRLGAIGLQAGLIVALGIATWSNVANAPKLNWLIGMIHSNPYPYGVLNEIGDYWLRRTTDPSAEPLQTLIVPICDEDDVARRFETLLDELDVTDPGTRKAYMHYPANPFVDERFVRAQFMMMSYAPGPELRFVDAPSGMC